MTQSFYVPQAGPVATPAEGANAIRFFHQCPNNDDGALTSNSARIKIVLKDASGVPVVGLPAADIYVLLNGGTAAQGFGGLGADSIIANSTWNVLPPCPDLRHIEADAATDVSGVTYITFAGSAPGSPGVAARDPSRKWGHYDSQLPVFVLDPILGLLQLQGRLTSTSPLGSYVLLIKNLDIVDGLDATLDAGEYVSFRDVNAAQQEIAILAPYNFWLDLDNNGIVNSIDLNFIKAHQNHHCMFPNAP